MDSTTTGHNLEDKVYLKTWLSPAEVATQLSSGVPNFCVDLVGLSRKNCDLKNENKKINTS